jgi:hypothetical protein
MRLPCTEVYALETFPVDNAVITPRNPPCQTLCVRRCKDLPFLAVDDAWRDQPNLLSISGSDAGSSLLLRTRSNTWHLCFGPGKSRFADGLSLDTDAAFALLRNRDANFLVHGTRLDIDTSAGTLRASLDQPASLSAKCADRTVSLETSGDIQYDTWGGRDRYRPASPVKVTFDGTLWHVETQRPVMHPPGCSTGLFSVAYSSLSQPRRRAVILVSRLEAGVPEFDTLRGIW